jgi:hypothetical protein
VVGDLVSCILAMVGETNLRCVEVFQSRDGSWRESGFHLVWEGCFVKYLLWNRCEAVLEAEWKGFGDEYAVSGLEEVRADKAESLGGCGALFREIFSPLFFNAVII